MSQSPYTAPPQTARQQKSIVPILVIVIVCLLVLMMACGGILVALLLPAVGAARTAAQRMQSSNNMKQIGLALHNYHAAYGVFPPVHATDADGNPTVSWRVLILPFMEHQQLAEQFRLDEPWDSPHNKALLARMPVEYRSPLADETSATDTNYFAILHDRGVFSGGEPASLRDITDGTSNTVIAVELSNRGVPWTSPDGLTADEAVAGLQSLAGPAEAGHVLFADGSVQYVGGDVEPVEFRAMVTRDGSDN